MRLKQIIGGERLVCEWIGTYWYAVTTVYKYFILDITTDTALLHEMRQKSAIERALPPQIFHGDEYLGVSASTYWMQIAINTIINMIPLALISFGEERFFRTWKH